MQADRRRRQIGQAVAGPILARWGEFRRPRPAEGKHEDVSGAFIDRLYLGHAGLSREQKIEILRRWEYDEAEIAVAEEEGMPDGRPLMLRQILLALEQLVGDIDTDRRPPTKQGGG